MCHLYKKWLSKCVQLTGLTCLSKNTTTNTQLERENCMLERKLKFLTIQTLLNAFHNYKKVKLMLFLNSTIQY